VQAGGRQLAPSHRVGTRRTLLAAAVVACTAWAGAPGRTAYRRTVRADSRRMSSRSGGGSDANGNARTKMYGGWASESARGDARSDGRARTPAKSNHWARRCRRRWCVSGAENGRSPALAAGTRVSSCSVACAVRGVPMAVASATTRRTAGCRKCCSARPSAGQKGTCTAARSGRCRPPSWRCAAGCAGTGYTPRGRSRIQS